MRSVRESGGRSVWESGGRSVRESGVRSVRESGMQVCVWVWGGYARVVKQRIHVFEVMILCMCILSDFELSSIPVAHHSRLSSVIRITDGS